jgi:hypothetical protein
MTRMLYVRPASVGLLAMLLAAPVWAQASNTPPADAKPTLEIYGFAQADAIVDFDQNDPNWFDVSRPSRLPSFPKQFGEDGHFYLSARQSRFGVKGVAPTTSGPVTAVFEFDLFGVGPDVGQTTFRLRHAYGQWKQFGAGQTNSPFMDPDVFPNVLDYWAPNGMLLYRNVQVFWRPLQGATRVTIALERPGVNGDSGVFADRIDLQNIKPRFPAPDVTGEYRVAQKWGYVKTSGVLRRINYDDTVEDQIDLSGHVTGWGVSFSSNVKAGPNDTLKLQYVFGEGIENYFNDAPKDVGVKTNPGNSVTPLVGDALPVQGLVLYLDHNWNSRWSTSAGYSRNDVTNSDGQSPSAYKSGQYVSVNLLCTPVKNAIMGGEFQWARRENFSDGFNVSGVRLQFSFKYSFSSKLGD